MKIPKHDLRPILSCRTRKYATQNPSAPPIVRNLHFWWSQLARKGIFIFISCIIGKKRVKWWSHFASLKMHRRHSHLKFQPKWIHTRTSQLATAHRNSQLAIAHRKSCFVKYTLKFSNLYNAQQLVTRLFFPIHRQPKKLWHVARWKAIHYSKLVLLLIILCSHQLLSSFPHRT